MNIPHKLHNLPSRLAKIVPVLVTIASLITAFTPAPASDTREALLIAHKVLDILAVNVLNNAKHLENVDHARVVDKTLLPPVQ